MVNVESPFRKTLVGRKDFNGTRAGVFTCNVAVEVFPVPPLVEVTVTLFTLSPNEVGVTSTVTIQVPPGAGGKEPPVRETNPVPGAAETLPPQVLFTLFGVPTRSPAGSRSMNPIPARVVVVFALVMLNFIVDTPFCRTMIGRNDFSILGGDITVKVPEPDVPSPPSIDEIGPVVFKKTPPVVGLTSTIMVQDESAVSLAPDNVREPAPFAAVRVPPQRFIAFPGVAMTIPGGNVSVNPTPFKVGPLLGLGFLKVNVIFDVSPRIMLSGVKILVIVGGATTRSTACVVMPVPPFVDVTVASFNFDPGVVPVTFTLRVQLAS